MNFAVFIDVVEVCAGLAGGICWGTAALNSRRIFTSTQPDEMIIRFRVASRWVVRAAVLTALSTFGTAAGALYSIVGRAF